MDNSNNTNENDAGENSYIDDYNILIKMMILKNLYLDCGLDMCPTNPRQL